MGGDAKNLIGVFHTIYEQVTFMTSYSSTLPPSDRTSVLPELQSLMSDIFEYAQALPDQVYKNMLDNCASVQRSIGQLTTLKTPETSTSSLLWKAKFEQKATELATLRYHYKHLEEENKNLLKRIEENSVPPLGSVSTPGSVCCFKGLKTAFERDPSIQAKTARCGCCHKNYPIGYGGQNFRSEAQKHHRETCEHTHKTCGRCHGDARRARQAEILATRGY